MSLPTVAVITVSYASEGVLGDFLDSLAAASTSPLHVVIADNKPEPTGGIRSFAAEHGAEYLPLPGNRGYGHAINAAAAGLPEHIEWIVVCNPDLEFKPRAIDIMLAAASSTARIAAVGPSVLNPDGTLYPSARMIPSIRTGVGHALFANIWKANPWTRAYLSHDAPGGPAREAGWLSGSCMLVRRSAFDRVGGFDEGYFMYFEDVDLGYRLAKAGYTNLYVPEAAAVHTGAHSTEGESARMLAAHHDSAKRFLSKKYSGPWLWPVRQALFLGLGLRSRFQQKRASR